MPFKTTPWPSTKDASFSIEATLKETADLPPEVAEPFNNSRKEMKASMDDPVIDTLKVDGATVYTACSEHCEAFVVQDSQAEQILHLTSRGFSQSELISILEGE